MSINLIGDKEIFAIEYAVLTPEFFYGTCVLWIGGNCLGGLEGEVFLNIVCDHLKGKYSYKNQLFIEPHLYSLSNAELFDLMQKDKLDENGRYWFLYTEGFDSFSKYIYRKDEVFYFLWQLNQEVWEEFKPKGISTQLFSSQVPISMYKKVVEQFGYELIESYNF